MTVLIITLIAISITCGIFLIYPYIIYPIVLRCYGTVPVEAVEGYTLSCTLVFCAYNEGNVMPEKIANLEHLKLRHPNLEILAFDDGSIDDTCIQLESRNDILKVFRGDGRSGKAFGMKLLASKAAGDILIFTDANVMLKEDAIEKIMAYYADKNVGGVCGSLHYRGENNSSTANVGSLYWKLEEYLKKEESRTGNVMGADGSIFSLRRNLYPAFPNTVLDDLTVSMAAVFSGHRLIKAEDVVAYEKLVTNRGEEFSRKVRIAARAFHTHIFLRPQLGNMQRFDKFKYSSRKFVRWFGAAFLSFGLISVALASALLSTWLLLALMVVVIAVAVAASLAKNGPLASLMEIVIALYATLFGVFRAIRGETVSVWNPAKSR